MHVLTFALIAQTTLAGQLGAAEALDMAGPAACLGTAGADLEAVVEVLSAPSDGRWWLSRFDDGGALRFEGAELSVIDGGGEEHLVNDVHLTPAAASLGVPSGLPPGSVVQLRARGLAVPGALLRVAGGEAPPVTLLVDEASVEGTTPTSCELFCRSEGMTVPAAPLLRLRYRGGPAVLDAWAVREGAAMDDLTPRVVDSQLLEASEEEVEHTVRLDEVGFSTGLDVRVRVLAPDTLEVLFDDAFALAPLPEVSAEELDDRDDVPACGDGRGGPGLSCASAAVPADGLAPLFALLSLALLRRRARDRLAAPVTARAPKHSPPR